MPKTIQDRVRWKITATLQEDTHLGSGTGGGGIDALITRDRNGKPVIWASHLEGILRTAAARLYDDRKVQQLFGACGGLRQQAIFSSLYVDAASFPVAHIWSASARTSFDNRAPKDDSLRVQEYIPQGTVFIGHAELCPLDEELFGRLFQEVFAVGQGRSGGAGRITFVHEYQPLPSAEPSTQPSTQDSTRLLLLLKNIDPMCIAGTGTPDNLIPTAAYIPGRTLQGAIAAWLFADNQPEIAQQLVDGVVKISDALPLPHSHDDWPNHPLSNLSVIPAPLALKHKKPSSQSQDLPWWAEISSGIQRYDAIKDAQQRQLKRQLKRPSERLFLAQQHPGVWQEYEPKLRVRLRTAYSQSKDANLFSIESIVEKTLFFAELEGDVSALSAVANALSPIFNRSRWLRIGRSGAPVEILRSEWAAQRRLSKVTDHGYFTLTSDLLTRDRHLRWISTLTSENITTIANWPQDLQIDDQQSHQENTTINGFNGTSRLQRLPAIGIRRGSVFVLSGTGVQRLSEMAHQGFWLGERTHEGFGRFRIDQELPGISHPGETSPADQPSLQAHSEEEIARETCHWAKEYLKKCKPEQPGPSCNQWSDFIHEYNNSGELAFSTRINPATQGKMAWGDPQAKLILRRLMKKSESHAEHTPAYLHYFVRWKNALSNEKGIQQ